MVSVAVYIVIAAVSLLIYFLKLRKKKNLPPGPIGLPFIGHAIQLGSRPYLKLGEWSKTYGPIFNINFGPNKTVVISDLKLLKEMFNDPSFAGRPQDEMFLAISGGSYGVINSEKEQWEAQRRFTLRHLRDFGFGKSTIETLIMDEAKEILETFKKEEGKPIAVNRMFSLAVLNSLWTIVSGTRHSQNDPHLTQLLDNFNKLATELTESGLFLFAPWLMKLAPEWSKYNKFLDVVKNFSNIMKEAMDSHKDSLPEVGNPRDFVDAYYHEINKTSDTSSSFYKDVGEKNLFAVLGDLFQAGAETTSATLAWAVLYLAGNPDVQEKLQKEIDQVIGNSRLPSLDDKPKMPYCEALTMEVMRKSTILPMGVFHTALVDKEVNGHLVEKGDWLLANVYAIHSDKNIWTDPENFRPERFLTEDGKTVMKNEGFIPFLVGKRQCLGESLARDSLFLFLTTIFQKFSMKMHLPNGGQPDYEPTIAFLLNPKTFHVIMIDRL